MVVSGLVTVLNFALAAVVGARLLARRRGAGSETWLAGYFLGGAVLGNGCAVAAYAALGEAARMSPALEQGLLACASLGHLVGGFSLLLFTWQTFRPDDRAVAAGVGAAGAILLVACGAKLALETRVEVFPGPAYWIERVLYAVVFGWIAFESLRYRAVLLRREAIGLAEPLLRNRFGLWGSWAIAGMVLTLSELAARGAYVWRLGVTETIEVEAALPILVVTVGATSLLGMVAAATLWLVCFPPPRYVAWIEGSSPESADPASA